MSKQKRFTKIALAATGLLAASITCFGQTDSPKAQTESTGIVAVATSNQPKLDESFSNYGSPTKANDEVVVTNHNTFSTEKFMSAARQSLTKTNPSFVTARSFEPRKDEFAKSSAPRRIEFVPSLGQRLPD
jgi:hypothetical protein